MCFHGYALITRKLNTFSYYISKTLTDTEKKDNTDDGTAQKKCTAEEVDMSVKESEDAVHTKSCETPPKKDQKNQRRDLKRHTVDVSTEFNSCISVVLYILKYYCLVSILYSYSYMGLHHQSCRRISISWYNQHMGFGKQMASKLK